jgi:hypothetical protein
MIVHYSEICISERCSLDDLHLTDKSSVLIAESCSYG